MSKPKIFGKKNKKSILLLAHRGTQPSTCEKQIKKGAKKQTDFIYTLRYIFSKFVLINLIPSAVVLRTSNASSGKKLNDTIKCQNFLFVFYILDLCIHLKTFGVYRYYNKNN